MQLEAQLTATYRERAHLVAFLTVLYPSAIIIDGDPDAPGWALVYVDSPTGQLSWHLSGDDLDLFPHVKRVETSAVTWDNHTTDEKYGRIRQLTADLATFPLPEPRRSNAEQQLARLHEGEEPHLDEAVVATPAQWIWRWNRTTPERRLEMAAALRLGLDERDRYERALRTIAERCPGHYGSVECTSAIAQAALTGPDERPNDDDLTGLLPGLNHIRTPDGAKDYSYWCPGGFGTCSGWLTAGHRTAAAATADYEQHVHRAHR